MPPPRVLPFSKPKRSNATPAPCIGERPFCIARGAVLRHFLDVGKPKSLQNLDYAFIILRYNAESRTDHAAPAYTDNILVLFLSAGELLRLLQAPRKRTRPRSSLPPRPQLPQTPNRQSDACRQTLRQQKKASFKRHAGLQSIFSLKCFAFQTIRPSFRGKSAVFLLTLGRAALCRHLAFHLF